MPSIIDQITTEDRDVNLLYNMLHGVAGAPGISIASFASKSKPWVDVTHPAFGADPTNSVDSQPAIQAAVNAAAASSTTGAIVFLPAGTYKLNSTVTMPTAGTTGLRIVGVGENSVLSPAAGISAFTFSAGYHYDPAFEQLKILGGTSPITITTTNQLVRLSISYVRFDSCVGAITVSGPVIGFTCRNTVFQSCSGHNINHDGVSQFNNILFDQCWFQSSNFTSYVNIPPASANVTTDVVFNRCLFEGPSSASATATMILGGIQTIEFNQCQWADFSNQSLSKPLISTPAAANSCPAFLTAIACDFQNGDGAIFNIGDSGTSVTSGQWQFLGGQLLSKAATVPFTFVAGRKIQNMLFLGTYLGVAQDWATNGAEVTYINVQEPQNTYILMKQWSAGALKLTMGSTGVVVGGALRRSSQAPTEAVLVSGVDASVGELISVTLTAARVVGAPLNPATGQRLTFTLIEGGAGGFAVTWNAVFKVTWSDTGNTTGKRSTISFWYDGTNWNQDGAQTAYV